MNDRVTLPIAADVMGIGTTTLRKWVRRGHLPSRPIVPIRGGVGFGDTVPGVRLQDVADYMASRGRWLNEDHISRAMDVAYDYRMFTEMGMSHDRACQRISEGYGIRHESIPAILAWLTTKETVAA